MFDHFLDLCQTVISLVAAAELFGRLGVLIVRKEPIELLDDAIRLIGLGDQPGAHPHDVVGRKLLLEEQRNLKARLARQQNRRGRAVSGVQDGEVARIAGLVEIDRPGDKPQHLALKATLKLPR